MAGAVFSSFPLTDHTRDRITTRSYTRIGPCCHCVSAYAFTYIWKGSGEDLRHFICVQTTEDCQSKPFQMPIRLRTDRTATPWLVYWSGMQDSNLRHLRSKHSTLPTELIPDKSGARPRNRTLLSRLQGECFTNKAWRANMAGKVGLEPTTGRLTAVCSTC